MRRVSIAVVLLALAATLLTPQSASAAAGDLDTSFSNDGKATFSGTGADDVLLQPDGRIVVAAAPDVLRLTTKGAMDGSWGVGGTASHPAGPCYTYSLARQSDGKIIVAGCVDTPLGRNFLVSRYVKSGNLDPTFGQGGTTITDFGEDAYVTSVVIQPNGKIVVAGWLDIVDTVEKTVRSFALARYLPSGALDTTYGAGGLVITEFPPGFFGEIWDAIFSGDGKILVVGNRRSDSDVHQSDIAIARYTSAGALDPTWGDSGLVVGDFGAFEEAAGVALDSAGRVVIAGRRSPEFYVSDGDMLVARYQMNGALDTSFGSAGSTLVDFGDGASAASDLAIQPDGKIVVVGTRYPYAYGTSYVFALARLTDGGLTDSSFGGGDGQVTTAFPEAGHFSFATSVAIQSDGKILVAGVTIRYNGADDPATVYTTVARYLATGSAPVCNFIGTAGSDYIIGTSGNDVICAGDGDDIIEGGSGNDLIYAGNGNDTVSGGFGDDTVFGGDGNDTIKGDRDRDALYGEAGADRLVGGGEPDYLSGGQGADVVDGKDGKPGDTVDGGPSTDTCVSDPGDTVTGCP